MKSLIGRREAAKDRDVDRRGCTDCLVSWLLEDTTCVCAADKKRAYEKLGAWDEPNATNQLSVLAPAAESHREKDGGGEGKTRKRCLGQGRS